MTNQTPKITIGLLAFNGEKFLQRRIDSILSQTFQDFELIISDNRSNDGTARISKEYMKKDDRIRYVCQETNIGYVNNFNFLVNLTRTKYFVAAAVDDLWEPSFLEETVKILELHDNVVGCIGKVKFFGYEKQPKINSKISRLKMLIRKQNYEPLYNHVMSAYGNYEEKANKYLRFNQGSFVYGLFRTEKIRSRLVNGPLYAWDLVVILNILKEGDLHVIDKELFKKYAHGLSSQGVFQSYKRGEIKLMDLIIPSSSLSLWCIKNIGFRFFLKNLDWFALLMIYGWYGTIKN